MQQGDLYYDGEVHAVELGTTGTGKEQLAITFAIVGADPTAPKFLTAYRFFTETSIEYTEKDLRTLGWDPHRNAWDLVGLIDSGQLLGRKASLTCAYETYDGKERLKVKFINEYGSTGGAVKDKMTPEEARGFQNRLRSRLGIQGAASTARPAARPAPSPELDGAPFDMGDDLPI